jgi:peptidoglycan/LPS O-acetylase OafA/YrhL
MIVFYSLWALFGFGLARAPSRFNVRDYTVVLALALAALAGALIVLSEQTTPDMQANKFPPNAVFFLFSCAWVSVFLIASKFISDQTIAKLAAHPLLKPFIHSGYSIYLWQGIGYTAAFWAGTRWHVNIWLIWLAAIVLTVALGLLASPLERIRVRLAPAK